MRITEEQIERANSVNLPSFLMSNGFALKKVGREYSWKEHDSLHIKDNAPGERGSWFRFSTDEGGDNISFVQQFMGKSFVEAVELLNGESYVRDFVPSHSYERKEIKKADISILENADSKRVFGYLCGTRGLDYDLVASLVRSGKIVQEQKTGNAVFKFFDENGKLVGAEKVGTSTEHKFKSIATGSASGYGFEVCKGDGENAIFFESAIDMLSYLQMYGSQLENHRLVSMMGVKPSIVIDTMERYGTSPENVFICSDNDKAGNEFADRLMSEYPQMKRVFTDSRFKDWNDMLRGIPIEKKEVGKVLTYGNKTWNDATDNRNKTLVSMNEDTFMKLKFNLDASGINYFAYAKNNSVVMAVNDKDIDWLKQIAGNDNLPTRKSNVEYIPPQKNIIGNAEYRYIPDKKYISADSDTALKMAEIMLSRNVQFSGRIYPNGKATLTVSGADLAHVMSIQQSIIDMRKQFARDTKANEVIGNKAYRDIRQRQIYYSKLTPEQYKEVQPYLDTNAEYSGLIRDNKVIFTVERDDSAAFHRALENAQREVGIINALKDNGIDGYRLEKLSAVIHRFAVEDIHESLDSFFTPQLDEKQFDKMLSLVNDYLAQAVSERYGEHSGLNAILNFKNEIDRMAELTEFFSEHSFSDEQKAVIAEMFAKDSSKANVEVIDETFTPDEIREYYDILHNQLDSGDVAEFLEQRKSAPEISDNATFDTVGQKSETVLNVYHGTTADFDKFKTDYRGAVWTTTDFESAKRYAGNSENSKVYEVTARLENPKHIEFSTSENWDIDKTIRDARAEGFDGAVIDFKFTAADNDFYKFALENYPDSPAEKILSSIIDAIGAVAFLNENETITEFDKRMQENDYTVHSYVAVFDVDKLEINNKISVYEKDDVVIEQADSAVDKDNATFDAMRQKSEDSLTFSFDKDSDGWFTESDVLYDFVAENPEISFALANAVMEYLDEKQHSERDIPELNAGWYKKTDFTVNAVINGEQFGYEGRFDIGDGKGTGGGSIIDHIRTYTEGIIERGGSPFSSDKAESLKNAHSMLDVFIPFLEQHSQLTAEEQRIFDDFKSKNPVRTFDDYAAEQGYFHIYQLKDDEKSADVGLNKDDYDHIYTGRMVDIPNDDKLEGIHAKFNWETKPLGFHGHNLRDSDVVVTDVMGELKAYRCNGDGFDEMPEFFSEKEPAVLEQAEKETEVKDMGPVTIRIAGEFCEMRDENARIAEEVLGLTAVDGVVRFSDSEKSEYAEKLSDAGYFVMNEEVFELNPPKRDVPEKTVDLMSDVSEVAENAPEETVNPLTIVFNGDSDSLNEIKDKALSLGATCTLIASGLVVDTYENHRDELLSTAYELGLLAEIRGEKTPDISEDDDTPLFADADVIEEIEKSENASDNRPFYEMPTLEGEQLSLFGDSVPLVAKKMPKQDKEVFAEGLFVGNVNRFSALHDEIMRGTGFESGKFRVKQFYDEKKPTNKEFADFLKNEYGMGSHTGDGEIFSIDYNSKGMVFTLRTGEKFKFTWADIADMTAEIIDNGEYITQGDIDRKNNNEKTDDKPTTIEVGDKFRNKITGKVSEVISLTGALPWYTDDCTVKRESGGFAIEENVPYAKLFDNNLYEYLGKGDVAEKADISAEISDKIAFEVLGGGKLTFKDNTMQVLADIDMNSGEISYYSDELSDKDKAHIAERAKGIEPKQAEIGEWTVFTEKNKDGVEFGYIGRLKDVTQEKSGRNTEWCEDYFDDNVPDFNVDFARAIARQMNEKGITDLKTAREFVSTAVSEREKILGIEKDTSLIDAIENDNAEKRSDFKITDDSLGSGGAKSKFKNNVAAIELLKTLERENRPATDAEKEVLSKYVGWGGIASAFDKGNNSWESEYAQLKELLTDKEYTSARASVLDAFFTSPTVIDGIYEALANFGFEGGNVLEPAMGVGNFFGRMPEDMKADSKLYGVEIDSVSGRIAQKLYPDADIAIKGFEHNTFQDGCFDVAVGNVPFGELGFTDNKHGTTKLHDFFFAETLDKIKSGGIVAFVTSAGTLDKRDDTTRRMLAEKAEFIGAVRLPGGKDGAFKDNAGTEVTTDIIFLQKKGADVPARENNDSWLSLGETADGLPINAYFAENPDMVLGTVIEGNKLYGSGTMVIANEGADLKEQLHMAVSKLTATISDEKAKDVYAKTAEGKVVEIPSNLRNYSFFEQDNNIYFKTSNSFCKFRFDTKNSQFKRTMAFIRMRDLTRELIEAQEHNKPDSVIADLQAKLNTAYDDFYKKFGLIHSQTNKRYFSEDVSYNLVAGLEKKYDKTKLIEKSDIFFKRTIQPPKAVEHVESAIEALTLSVAERAGVDFEYMSSLTGMTEDELKHDLQGEIYKVPHTENTYQTASEYLSGDIRAKLKTAEEVAEYDADFAVNVNALKSVMPTPLKAGDIDVKLGATWIDPKYYEQFMYEVFQTPRDNRADMSHSAWQKPRLITAEYSEHSGSWFINNKSQDRSVVAMQKFGTKQMGAYEILEHLLNLKEPKIYKTIEVPDGMGDTKEKRVVDVDATRVVQKKADQIRAEFKKWIFKDQTRREEIVGKYNELFNSIRPREFDGSALKFPMMNSDIQLHEHQKNAIAHAMFGGNTLFAHCVGAGKTFEMIATAMESKRLGLCTKSLFAVPNHLTEQIGDDFQKLYPGANILVATKKDFQKENRQQLFAKIATGNFDAVIIGHSQLGMIPLSKERQEAELISQIDDILIGIEELKKSEGSKFQIKAMERTKKSLEKQLDKLQKNHDDTITFEQLGIDKLFVDEAHEFKNLFCPTKMNNISGISNSASQKALDLYLKCRYLDEKTGGTGVVFATGTPLSNSVTELHTMMRYLEYDFLKSKGLQHFDSWVSVFGEQKTDWELKPAGNGFKERTRIANYTGMPELMSMFKQIADIRTADTLKLDVPDCEYKVVQVEATPFQKELVEELSDRADAINSGNVDPHIDNMLKITSDGRKLGLDPRLIDPSFEDNPNTKLNQCVENVARIHAETAEDKLTQIIFCDLGVPHKNSAEAEKADGEAENDEKSAAERDSLEEECDFCVYDDIRDKLIAKGIPESEIAYIHDAKTEKQKAELFDKVRNGEIRVLLGSTSKMGTGTNVQKKLIAVHDLDIPWRPADLEQRAGRIIRQGNENKNVEIYRYVTKGTFDAYSYQTLENKQRFISQIMTSKEPMRKCEDVDQQALTYSEIKALCTGDERIKEKLMLDNEVKELKALEAEYQNTVYEMEDTIKAFPKREERLITALENLRSDKEHLRKLPIDAETKLPVFKITIEGTEYTDRKEAAKAFEDAVLSIKTADVPVKIGEFQGFPLSVTMNSPAMGGGVLATMQGAYPHTTKLIESFAHNLKRLEGALYNIDRKISDVNSELSKLRVDYAEAQKIVAEPFPQAEELVTKEERLKTLTAELNQAAIEAKKNAKPKEKTCYFERAKLKKEAMRLSKKKSDKSKDNSKNRGDGGID